MKEAEMAQIAGWIADILLNPQDEALRNDARGEVQALCDRFPIYDFMKKEGEFV